MLVNTLFIYSIVCWSPKITTIIIFASGVLLTSFSLFASSSFLISGLRNSGAYNAFSHLFHEQCRLLVTKDGHNHYISTETLVAVVFLTVCFSKFLISGLRIFERKMLFTTLFIVSVVCWSPKMVTIIIFQSKVFRWHLCQSLLLANSWFLVYESLERIMFFTTLFIVSVVFWSTKMITVIILALEVSLTSFSLFAFSIFLISGLRSSEA